MSFDKSLNRYGGKYRTRHFRCWEQFLVMSFAQLSSRESLRDIEGCLSSMQTKRYHCGLKSRVARSTLAGANESRGWEIYAEAGKGLMKAVAPPYKGQNKLAAELRRMIYAFDSTTMGLCLRLCPWAVYSSKGKGVKVQVLSVNLFERSEVTSGFFEQQTKTISHQPSLFDF